MKTGIVNTDKYQWIKEQIILFEDLIFPQESEGRE